MQRFSQRSLLLPHSVNSPFSRTVVASFSEKSKPTVSASSFSSTLNQKEIDASITSSLQTAVSNATKIANKVIYPSYSVLENMTIAAHILADEGHGGTLSGQITVRDTDKDGNLAMWTPQYGRSFEEMNPKRFIKINTKCETIEGYGGPNMAVRFHLHLYKVRPDIKAIVHTHPINSSILSQMGVPLFISHMDTMCFYDDVQFLNYWPGIPFGDEEGELLEKVMGKTHHAALLAHHGLLVSGKSLEEAVYRAYFFEKAAKMQLQMMAANGGNLQNLPKTDPTFSRYARDWRISEGPVKAHYYSWARRTIEKNGLDFGMKDL
jgi:L-fuculose-phosphate aldolase